MTRQPDRSQAAPAGLQIQPEVLAALPDRGEEWAIHFAFFARAGFSEAAQTEAKRHGAMLVDLATLDHDVGRYVKSA